MALELKDGVTLYIARHGETIANIEKRYQGQNTDTALTARGIAQMHDVAHILKREAGASSNIAFVSSPLHRARSCMEMVRGELGLPPQDYQTDARLAEINLGAWDGLTDEEVAAREPGQPQARNADKWNMRVPGGGENYADVAARARGFASSLAADSFALSHGAFIRILRGLLQGLDWQGMSALDEPQGVVFRIKGNVVEQLDPSAKSV